MDIPKFRTLMLEKYVPIIEKSFKESLQYQFCFNKESNEVETKVDVIITKTGQRISVPIVFVGTFRDGMFLFVNGIKSLLREEIVLFQTVNEIQLPTKIIDYVFSDFIFTMGDDHIIIPTFISLFHLSGTLIRFVTEDNITVYAIVQFPTKKEHINFKEFKRELDTIFHTKTIV